MSDDQNTADLPSIFSIAGMSLSALVEAVQDMPSLFVSGVVAFALVEFADHALTQIVGRPGGLTAWSIGAALRVLPVDTAIAICESLVAAVMAIPIHRLVLRNEKLDASISPFTPTALRFALWLTGLQLMWILLAFATHVLEGMIRPIPLFSALFVAGVAILVVQVRVSLVYPAIALDLPNTGIADMARQAFDLSRGRSWLIVLSEITAVFPLAIGIAIVSWAVWSLIPLVGSGETGNLRVWWNLLVRAIEQPFVVALGAAVLSWNYSFARTEDGRR
jgi:hypothetical protein